MNRKNILSALFAVFTVCVALGGSSAFAKDDVAKSTSCCAMACCQPGAACCKPGSSCCGSGCCGTSTKKKTVVAKKVAPVAKTIAPVVSVK